MPRPPMAPEQRAKIAAAARDRWAAMTPEQRMARTAPLRATVSGARVPGRPKSSEHRANISAATKRAWAALTPEERSRRAPRYRGPQPKISAALKGRPKSPEQIAKMRRGRYVPCEVCGEPVWRTPSHEALTAHTFCSSAHAARFFADARKKPCPPCARCGAPTPTFRSTYCSRACADAARAGAGHPRWKGGKHQTQDGYVLVNRANVPPEYRSMCGKAGRVLEHRLVMAMHLGRPLAEEEVVHHVDGVRDHNDLSNLELHPHLEHTGITRATTAIERENKALREEIAALRARLKEAD